MPVVNVGNKQNPSYLPVDVCIVEPGQPAGSKLTPNQTRNMLNFAVRAPALNAQSIVRQGSQVLGLTGNPTLVCNSSLSLFLTDVANRTRRASTFNRTLILSRFPGVSLSLLASATKTIG